MTRSYHSTVPSSLTLEQKRELAKKMVNRENPRPMIFGDIYLCHAPILARGDDLRKAWMWYASQSDAGGET